MARVTGTGVGWQGAVGVTTIHTSRSSHAKLTTQTKGCCGCWFGTVGDCLWRLSCERVPIAIVPNGSLSLSLLQQQQQQQQEEPGRDNPLATMYVQGGLGFRA